MKHGGALKKAFGDVYLDRKMTLGFISCLLVHDADRDDRRATSYQQTSDYSATEGEILRFSAKKKGAS